MVTNSVMEQMKKKKPKTSSRTISFGSIFMHADCSDMALMGLGLVGSFGDGISMPAMLLVTSKLMNSFGNSQISPADSFSRSINENALVLCYMACVQWVACFLEGYCWTRTAEKQASRLRSRYLKAVMRQDIGYFDLHVTSTAEVIESVSSDSLVIQDAISEKVPVFIMNLSTFFGSYVVAFIMLWRLALAGFPFIIVLVIPGLMYGRALMSIMRKMKNEYGKAGVIVEQALFSVRTVYSFVGESKTIAAYSDALQGTVKLGSRQGLAKGLAIGSNAVVFAIWSFLSYYGSRALGSGLSNLKYFSEASLAAERIKEVIERVPKIDSDSVEGQILEDVKGEVEFKHVEFAYPSRPESLIFEDFNLKVLAGKTVALVGGSGSGKSTVIALLQRFYDPLGGEILLDGVAIGELQVKWLRSQMGLVSQEPALFATSIKENILFGKEDGSFEEVVEAAKAANAHNFISQLPQGYETQVGERGVQMSGGQKQRIAIARAIIKSPKILLLDEATSALDSESEHAVQEALDKAAVGRTTLVIAHRLSTIRNADIITVVRDGRVVESGAHDELITDENGLYSSLVHLSEKTDTTPDEHRPSNVLDDVRSTSSRRLSVFSRSSSANSRGLVETGQTMINVARDEVFGTPSFRRLLAMNMPEWRQAALGCVSAVLFGAIQPVYAFAMGSMISVYFIQDHEAIMKKIRIYAWCFLGLAVFSLLINVCQHYSFASMGENLTKRIRERMLSKILTFEVGWFDRDENSTGAVCSRLAKDANVVRSLVGDRMALLIQTCSAVIIACTMGLAVAWKLALVMIAVQPLIIICYYFKRVLLKNMSSKAIKAQNESSKLAAEAVSNLRTVTAFSSQARILRMLELAQEGPRKESARQSWFAGVGLGTSQSLMTCTWALDFWYGGRLIAGGFIGAKALFQTFMILVSTGRVIADAGTMTNDLAKGADAVRSVFAILDRYSLIEPEDPDGHRPDGKVGGRVDFRGVDFAYPARPKTMILQGFSLEIEAGKSTALVGPSGSGKSTVIGLIERFYDPIAGVVKIDGRDIRTYHLRSLRKHIALVSQEPTLFAGTVRENIAYGSSEDVTEAEVVAAAKLANAHDFISGLKDGYETWCGDRGVQMSGGQKQRIAIARAILKNPSILLLDEATSALDTESEKAVQEALERVMVGRTSMVVAHRLSTIKNCDTIAVLDGGRVVERGTHTSLLGRGPGGVYYSLEWDFPFRKKLHENLSKVFSTQIPVAAKEEMKRIRDEMYMNPQFKRPFGGSRGESYVPSQSPSGDGGDGGGVGRVNGGTEVNGNDAGIVASSTQKLTTNDALSYLKHVKDKFQDQRGKYDRFLDVMKDFKAQRIDTAGVIARVKELFKGHPNLILGFNTFLPKGFEITLTDEEEALPKKTVEFEEAISFVNKIKRRFQNDDHVYKSFLDILNMYRKEHKGIAEVYREVAALFDDHPDLLDEFTRFLPDTSATASAPHASLGRHSFLRNDEKSSALPTILPLGDRTMHPKRERDLSADCPDNDDDKTVVKLPKEQKKLTERENRDKRNCDQDDRDPDLEKSGNFSMHRLSDKKKSTRKVEDLCGVHVNSFDDKDALKSTYNYEFSFCQKVKERLQSADDYQAFLKCLHIYCTEIITRKELQSLRLASLFHTAALAISIMFIAMLVENIDGFYTFAFLWVTDLLGKYPDLMEGFNEFLERYGFLAGVMGKKTLWNEGNSSKASRIDEKEREQKRDLEGGKERDRCNLKYWGKSIQELDLSNCQQCTPSYRLLPKDYPISSASQRSELGAQVLNDHWVSVTSGSEDYSFKHMRRNQYEESLFRCEDDRFELDMLLESVSSTAKRAEELLNSINNNSVGSDGPILIEDYFTALNLRCIERLYGDHGLDVMDILRKNPSRTLPVVLMRLKQKQEEWTKCRSDFNKVWAEIYSKNHYRSLDHRSFYFKQQDSKNLSTKSLVAEIKELKDKRQKEDDVLLSIAAGRRHSVITDLEFEYANAEVHEDIFKIIKYSCEEICSTKDQCNKVLRFWTTFLEPMFGVHSHPHGLETNEDDGVSKHQNTKDDTSLMEREGSPDTNLTNTDLKQPKSNCNGDSKASPQRMNFRTGFTNVGGLAKEGLAVASGERLTNPDSAVTSGTDINHGCCASSPKVGNGAFEEGNEAKSNTDDMVPSEDEDKMRENGSANGDFAERSRHLRYNECPVDPCKNEKEEGELSPNCDSEDNFGVCQDSILQVLPEENHGNEGSHGQMGNHKENTAGENDIDADDDDSGNTSNAGGDVSGSESAGDECSREDPDEVEDGKAESECEAVPHSERFLLKCKPLSKHVASSLINDEKQDRRVFYGNDTFYVLFRLHQTLFERILFAKVNSVCGDSKWRNTQDSTPDPYARFTGALFSLLDGSIDNTKFEDDCRSLIGNQSYVLFTLDKLIYKLVRQLQTVSSDEVDCKLLQLFEYEKSRKLENFVDSVYYENVHVLLHDENIYRFECICNPTRLFIQLMDGGDEKSEGVAVSVDPKFATYLHKEYLSVNNGKESSSVMLKRNIRKYSNIEESTALYRAMENVLITNGLECKMTASTSKISYVLDTEDSFVRSGRRKVRSLPDNQTRIQRFHKFLEASTANSNGTPL
ncbi:ABC transporter B family member [Striga asiatica]|uniref:ABC transporter B family member n=1 Tax=Striga asiatica TaxID=4170 RepID=A0A5A7PAA7_STRAF|nr:ABC transporter B family member [Striga asiatica]